LKRCLLSFLQHWCDDSAFLMGADVRMARWRVDIIRKRAEHLGTVEAANEKEAIEKAAKEFAIPPERRNRLIAQKIGAKD
jgi:hypothetical protein